jgi:hypothetical protein
MGWSFERRARPVGRMATYGQDMNHADPFMRDVPRRRRAGGLFGNLAQRSQLPQEDEHPRHQAEEKSQNNMQIHRGGDLPQDASLKSPATKSSLITSTPPAAAAPSAYFHSEAVQVKLVAQETCELEARSATLRSCKQLAPTFLAPPSYHEPRRLQTKMLQSKLLAHGDLRTDDPAGWGIWRV